MLKELLKPEIQELINEHNWIDLKDVLASWPAPEIVDLFLDVDKQYRVLIFRALPRELSAEVFSYLDFDQQESFLFDLTDTETRQLLSDLPPDDRTDLLEELPAKVTRRLLNLLNPDDLKEARKLLGYPEESVGRQMTPDYIAVRSNWTIKEAIEHIRRFGRKSETFNRIYVTDKAGKLLDDILLRNLILAEEDEIIANLMDFNAISLTAFDDQEKAVEIMDKYDMTALPVVDSQGMLVGIVTFDDIMDIQKEEATEDIHKISAINPVEQPYMSATVWKLWIKRVPWLIALLFANFLTASAISYYSDVLIQIVVLASFQPLLIGTAGNSGTQSATLIIRSIAVDGLNFTSWFKVLRKELVVGLLLGVALGTITFLRGLFEGNELNFKMATVISLSMVIMVLWANIVGSLLPLLLSKMKFDPAVISSPFMTTFIDVTGIVIYFNIAIIVYQL